MKNSICLVLCIFFLQFAQNSFCQVFGTGLEAGGDKRVSVVVERMTADGGQIGLIERVIKNKVELQLRRNGLIPVDEETGIRRGMYLYININVVGLSYSWAVRFYRRVVYWVEEEPYFLLTTTWNIGGVGTHGGDSKYIIDFLLDGVDIFSNAFLSVNPER